MSSVIRATNVGLRDRLIEPDRKGSITVGAGSILGRNVLVAGDPLHRLKNPGVSDSARLDLFFYHLAPRPPEVDLLA